MVKLIQSTQNTISYERDLTETSIVINETQSDWTTRYHIDINLALLALTQIKEFERAYKEQYKNFKKGIKK